MRGEIYTRIVECLQDVLNRPGMYFGPQATVEQVFAFINGFDTACSVLGVRGDYTDQAYQKVLYERNWLETSTRGIWTVMRERGMSDDAIIKEMLLIELEAWERRADYDQDIL